MYIKTGVWEECPRIIVNGEPLEIVKSMKYLGVIIDDKLNLKKNINYVCKKVAQKVGFLGRISRNLTLKARFNVYRTVIVPHFQYCASLPYSTNCGEIDKLQKLQNRASRIILRFNRFTNVELMLKLLATMSVKQHLVFATLKLVFKIKKTDSCPKICRKCVYTMATRHPRT